MVYSDRRVIISLLIVGIAMMGILFVLTDDNHTESVRARKEAPEKSKHRYYHTQGQRVESFVFDPNTADSTQLLRLGLRPWQVRNIYKYRSKGGIYRTKADFARLYGLTVKDYRRLEPYIRISADYQSAASLFADDRHPRDTSRMRRDSLYQHRDTTKWIKKITNTQRIVLNTANEETLRQVPGIGTFYAKEIIRHGKWIGGYVDVNQLDEIENFPKQAKQYFVISKPNPSKLKINELSFSALRRHPYINFYQAKDIIDYRRLYGRIHSLADLEFSAAFSEHDLKRLEPYVEF